MTRLSVSKATKPQQEGFDQWYSGISLQQGLDPNPDDPRHFYDYRQAYAEGVRNVDEAGHFPSKYKLSGHPRTIIDGINTITGEPEEQSLNLSNSRFSQAAAEETQRRQDEYSREVQSRLSRLQESRQQWKREQLSPDTLLRLDEKIATVKKGDKLYRNYLSNKYEQNLTSTLRGIRLKAAKKATEEVTDPSDRQWLVRRVAETGEARKFTRTQERAEAGYGKRFGIAAQEIGGAFADAGTEQLEAFTGAGEVIMQEGKSKGDVSFLRDLEFANQSTNKNVSRIDTEGIAGNAIRLAQEASVTSAGMAPDMAAGLLSLSAGGVGASTAYWATRNLTERRDDFVELGMNEKDALLVGGASSLIEGAIENIIPDPSGMLKRTGVGRKLVGSKIKTLVKEAGTQTLRFAGELLEESLQAATDEGMKYLAGETSDRVQRRDPNEIHRRAVQAARAAAPGLGVMSLAFGGGNIASSLSQARMRTINNEIMSASRKGITPSRAQWKRWTGSREKISGADRKQALSKLAEGIAILDRIETLSEGTVPTADQWKNWGMPLEEGKTEQDRLLYLNREYVVNADQVPPGATVAEEGVPSRTEASEALQQAPTASEVVQEVPEGEALATEAAQTPPTSTIEVSESPTIQTDEVDVTDSVKITDSAIGNFIQDAAGRIGIDIEKAGRGLKKAKGIGQRLALSRGELPQSIFEAKVRKEGFEAKIETRLRFAVNKFRKIEKKVFGKDGMSGGNVALVRLALQGSEVAMEILDPKIHLVISEIRQQVDALSAQLRSTGAIAGNLAAVVEGNEGTYLTTTYRAFQGPKWAQDVPSEIKNAYADFVRKEFPDKTNEEIDGMIGKILYDAEQSGSPIAMAKQAQLGAKDVSILTPKKDLPDELKALLGEEEDPILNYAMSVTKLGSLIANHQFQMDVRNANGGEYFSKDAIAGTDKGDMVAAIELANETFYTTPELKAAMDREYQRDTLPAWLRHYMKANAAVKISKTLLSQQAQVRNIEANVLLSVANAHWRLGMSKPAWKATWANFVGKGSKGSQNLIESAVEYQVVGQDVRAGELADLVNDAANSVDIESHVYSYEAKRASIVKKALRKGLRVAARAYQAGDDFFKLYAWLNERARYKKAYPNATGAEIKQKAAEVVRNTFPNYSLIPEGVKQIRKLPIIGSFVSFRSEMIRVTYKAILLTAKEIANPATRKIGYARFAGMSAAAYAIPSLANALRLFYKVSKEDEEDLRHFLPDYQKNSTLAHTTGNIDGEFGIIDLTYVDPHGSFRQMWNAFVTGDDLADKVLGALKELVEPFISDEILFAKLVDVSRNQKKTGGDIYNEEDELDKIMEDIVAHVWDAFEPGTITSVERGVKGITGYVSDRGQTYSAAVEAGAAFLGQRVSDRSVRDSFPFVLRKLAKRRTKAEDILNDTMTRGGKVSDSEIAEAYDSSTNARKAIFSEMSEVSGAAGRLLKNPNEVSRMLTASGISVRDKKSILTEVYFKKIYTDAFWSRVRTANPQEFVQRRAVLFRLSRGNLEKPKKGALQTQ